MRTYKRTIDTLPLDGGWLCLDFINTVRNWTEKPISCYLPDNDEILKWARRVNLFSYKKAGEIMEYNKKNPDIAKKDHNRIINIRKTLYQMFSDIANDLTPAEHVLKKFNKYLSNTFNNFNIIVDENRVVTENLKKSNTGMHQFQVLIIKSAYELLKSDMLKALKQCDKCGWLFLDRSKNKSRKWCNMETCGSSEKSMKYYRKVKSAKRESFIHIQDTATGLK